MIGKVGQTRQRCQSNLRLELVTSTIAKRIVEVAGEFHEQIRVQAGFRMRIFDRKKYLVARIAAGKGFETSDACHTVVSRKRSEILKSFGQKRLACVAQRRGMRGNRKTRRIAATRNREVSRSLVGSHQPSFSFKKRLTD